MTATVIISNWGWPQWVWMILSLLTLVGCISFHGKQRPAYSGYVGLCNFLTAFLLLAAGGFFA